MRIAVSVLWAENEVTERYQARIFFDKKTMYIRYNFDPIDRSYIEVMSFLVISCHLPGTLQGSFKVSGRRKE
jgi:hypothetical protein